MTRPTTLFLRALVTCCLVSGAVTTSMAQEIKTQKIRPLDWSMLGDGPGNDELAAVCTSVMALSQDGMGGAKPEDWTWANNVYSGTLGIPPTNGLRKGTPALNITKGAVALPTRNTPSAKEPVPGVKAPEKDMCGASRGTTATVGAIQFSNTMTAVKPLTAKQVGPEAK